MLVTAYLELELAAGTHEVLDGMPDPVAGRAAAILSIKVNTETEGSQINRAEGKARGSLAVLQSQQPGLPQGGSMPWTRSSVFDGWGLGSRALDTLGSG